MATVVEHSFKNYGTDEDGMVLFVCKPFMEMEQWKIQSHFHVNILFIYSIELK